MSAATAGGTVTVGIVAGEASGDGLAATLIHAVRTRCPNVRFAGIAGPRMEAAGCEAWYPLEKLAVRGFAWLLERTVGVGGAVGVSAAANVFVGMIEAPLVVRPYLARLSRSELFIVMNCGMATIAGRLSLADVAAISGWLASEPVPDDATPAPDVNHPMPLACGSEPERRP